MSLFLGVMESSSICTFCLPEQRWFFSLRAHALLTSFFLDYYKHIYSITLEVIIWPWSDLYYAERNSISFLGGATRQTVQRQDKQQSKPLVTTKKTSPNMASQPQTVLSHRNGLLKSLENIALKYPSRYPRSLTEKVFSVIKMCNIWDYSIVSKQFQKIQMLNKI